MGLSAFLRRGLIASALAVAAVLGVARAQAAAPQATASLAMQPLPAVQAAETAPTAAGDFAFLANDQGRPVRYDPCTPIHYVVNLTQAPPEAQTDVQQAVAELADATGLTFVFDGVTDEVPVAHRGIQKDGRYRGWPPVLIGWVKPTDTDLLTGGAIGEGGSTWFGNAGSEVYVTGVVAIDATQNSKLSAGFGGDSVGAVLLHELGHVVGLDHAGDVSQIMYPTVTNKPAAYGVGDLAGLHELGGEHGCIHDPKPPWGA